ncbi:hypothetical protein QP835_15300 [Pseudomonas oryzihabitans]|jgi:hypothetical protein|uniref:hypothetical protein n=1 Tax=Pseudomonas oryzihabitans TaxID=47885 RepID=UPI002557811D|nr:hypothetical protein [Pseudomonas oryzihabitans]MDK8265648.1 hypothetical protein [Pseudomonas oryzihabitans]
MDINTSVSAGLHPAVIENIEGYNEDTASHVADALHAFTTAYDKLGKINQFREAIAPDTSLTEDAKLLRVSDYAGNRMGEATKAFDNADKSLLQRIDHLERELSAPLKATKSTTGLTVEIRAHVKALPTDERRAWFSDALEANDATSIEAVLAGPGYLSGLNTEEVAHYARLYHEKLNPQAFQRLQVMKQAHALLRERSQLVFSGVQKAMGSDFAKVQKVRERIKASQKKVDGLETDEDRRQYHLNSLMRGLRG